MTSADSRFCVDEEALLAAHRARLLAMPADAFGMRAKIGSLVLHWFAPDGSPEPPPPDVFADPSVRANVVDEMLRSHRSLNQYELGVMMQYAHTPAWENARCTVPDDEHKAAKFLAKMPPRAALGDLTGADEEALGWFLAAARHGHAGAMDAVALYLQADKGPGSMPVTRLTPWPHDAAFYLWKATQHGVPVSAAMLDRFSFRLQHFFVPLALKDAQGADDADTVKRLVRLLHTGPRLAEVAAPPNEDAAAQFLWATQLLGTPAPRLRVEHTVGDPRPDGTPSLVTAVTIEFHDVTRGAGTEPRRRAKAQALLRASAAAGFEPAISFLTAAGEDLCDVASAMGPTPAALQRLYENADSADGIPTIVRLISYGTRENLAEQHRELALTAAQNNLAPPNQPYTLRKPGERCERCGRTDVKMRLCGKCRAARYCSEACQRAAWKLHKQTCVPIEEP
jgi:TPR repeat protein